MIRPLVCLIALATASCGGADPPPPAAPPPPPPAAKQAPPPRPKSASGTLSRKDVTGFIDAGFPRLLQMVEVQAALENGKFKGWKIVSLRPPEFWQTVDLEPGDVVTSVNELPIERETEAFDAFQSLKTADKIVVSFQRGGTLRTLDYRVVGDSPQTPAPKKQE